MGERVQQTNQVCVKVIILRNVLCLLVPMSVSTAEIHIYSVHGYIRYADNSKLAESQLTFKASRHAYTHNLCFTMYFLSEVFVVIPVIYVMQVSHNCFFNFMFVCVWHFF